MIKLQNGYSIEGSDNALTLMKEKIKKDEEGNESTTKVKIGYYSTLSSALQAYANHVVIDAVTDFDLDLKQVRDIIDKVHEELDTY